MSSGAFMAKTPDPLQGVRRFYTAVTVEREAEGFAVLLDGRSLRTPEKARLSAPTAALAELIADEWRGQGDVVRMASMPATRLAYTTQDRVGDARGAVAAEVARAAGADLLCYFALAPQTLVERQTRRWGAVLDWAETELGLSLVRVVGVGHRIQPPETLARVEALAAALDDFSLAGLALATSLFSSALLAFALQRDLLDGAAAFELSRLDEMFQEEQWGVDADAQARTDAMRAEATMLEQWFLALR
jgi:chaperone required for assembly of F1-ATPase